MNLFTLIATAIVLQTPSAKPQQAAPPAPVVTVTVRPQNEVAGAKVIVSDIADVTGSDKTLAAQVSAVEVGAAPLIGLSRNLMRADIITRLRFNKIDADRVEIVSAPTFKVTRVGKEVPVPEVVEFATNAIKATQKDVANTVIEAVPSPYKWVVPPGKREMQAGPIRGSVDAGVATVPVTFLVDGKPAKTVEISFKIKKLGPVLVATRQLEAHAVLKAEDVSVTTQEVAAGSVALTDPALVIGMRTTRQIAAGAVLTKATVETAPVISIGTPVDVKVVIGGITVATSGVARSQGAVGERIRVFISKTSKEVSATVVDAKTVRMEENG